MWDVFQLRATATLQARVQGQLEALHQSEHLLQSVTDHQHEIALIRRLRALEERLLQAADQTFERQKEELLKSASVISYLQGGSADDGSTEDFS